MSFSRRQFALGIVVLVTVVGLLVSAAILIYVGRFRDAQATARRLRDRGASVRTDVSAPRWMTKLFGDSTFNQPVFLDISNVPMSHEELVEVRRLKAVEVLVVGGRGFQTEQLDLVREFPRLRAVILDSTSVTDQQIARLKASHPELQVHRISRRVLEAMERLSAMKPTMTPTNWSSSALWWADQDGEGRSAGVNDWMVMNEAEVDLPAWLLGQLGRHNCVTVEGLRIEGCEIDSDTFARFPWESVPKLRVLHVINTKVDDAGFCAIAPLTELEILVVHGSPVSEIGLAVVNSNANLRYLRIEKVRAKSLAYLKGLNNLRELDIHDSIVTDADLRFIGALEGLEKLSLTGTEVTDAGVRHLRKLDSLTCLALDDTAITNAGALELGELRSLQTLSLDCPCVTERAILHLQQNNQGLQVAGPARLYDTSDVRSRLSARIESASGQLFLDEVEVSHLDLVVGAEHLRVLGLPEFRNTDELLKTVSTMSGLTELYLANSGVTDEGMRQIGRLSNLRRLDLEDTRVTDDGLEFLTGLKKLEELNLHNTMVSGAGLRFLDEIPRLTVLVLSRNDEVLGRWGPRLRLVEPLGDHFAKYLGNLKQVTKLKLSGTLLSDETLPILASLPNLRELELQRTQVTAEGVRWFLDNCPEVKLFSSHQPE